MIQRGGSSSKCRWTGPITPSTPYRSHASNKVSSHRSLGNSSSSRKARNSPWPRRVDPKPKRGNADGGIGRRVDAEATRLSGDGVERRRAAFGEPGHRLRGLREPRPSTRELLEQLHVGTAPQTFWRETAVVPIDGHSAAELQRVV